MRVHKGGQINNVQLTMRWGLQRCHTYKIAVSKYSKSIAGIFLKKKKKKKNTQKTRTEIIVEIKINNGVAGVGGWGL